MRVELSFFTSANLVKHLAFDRSKGKILLERDVIRKTKNFKFFVVPTLELRSKFSMVLILALNPAQFEARSFARLQKWGQFFCGTKLGPFNSTIAVFGSCFPRHRYQERIVTIKAVLLHNLNAPTTTLRRGIIAACISLSWPSSLSSVSSHRRVLTSK